MGALHYNARVSGEGSGLLRKMGEQSHRLIQPGNRIMAPSCHSLHQVPVKAELTLKTVQNALYAR